MSSTTPFEFSDEALDDLFDEPTELGGPRQALAPSAEVKALARSLTGQYIDVIRAFAAQAFGGRAASMDNSFTALDSLLRLADSIDDEALYSHLDALRAHLITGVPRAKLARTRFLNTLQARLRTLADALDDDHGRRLRELVDVDLRAAPLLDELRTVRGIGPRRLSRLYCAGLFTVDAVSEADPNEIALVTGLPMHLAQTVVDETRAFARRERQRCAEDLQARVRQLTEALPRVDARSDEGRALLEAAQHAFADLSFAIAQLRAGDPDELD